MNPKKCTVCGREYIPTAYNQSRCPDCAHARLMKCMFCGAVYTASAYNRPGNRSRCHECLSKQRGRQNTHAAHVNSDSARARASAARSKSAQSNIKKAIAALETHPSTAANSHQHAHAKIWILVDPHDNTVETQNIRAFVRERPDEFPNEQAAVKAFYILSASLRHPETVKHPQYSYHGWRLANEPLLPDDVIARKEYRALKETRRQQKREESSETP